VAALAAARLYVDGAALDLARGSRAPTGRGCPARPVAARRPELHRGQAPVDADDVRADGARSGIVVAPFGK
jgi:hypothetical protein